ncbi:MAG: DUF418 domain-containing protein [Saprospiraceae bacterium]|nr:DUF418 domain-containing protein [Saprospiraceae bacterium]
MQYNSLPAAPDDRLQLVDALRGFSLAGIAIVHFMEQYLAGSAPESVGNFTQQNIADSVLEIVTQILIRGKFFALFSFLFGLSFSLQMDRTQARTGQDFSLRFAWRLTVLFAIGLLHQCFYRGDILTVFALLGFPLLLFYRVSDRWIGALAVLLLLGVPRLIIQLSGISGMDLAPESIQHYWDTVKFGTFSEIAWLNSWDGFREKMEFQFGFFSRGYQSFGWFLLGLLAGRWRLFEMAESYRLLWRKLWRYGLFTFLGLIAVAALVFGVFGKQIPENWTNFIGSGFYDWANIALTFFYIGAFPLLFLKPVWQRRLLVFAPYGRMALSNYVLQALIGTSFFFSFGLGLIGEYGNSVTLPLGLAVCVLQIWWSARWLQHFQYGPLEWLWRSLTWFSWQPFRKK